MPGPSRNHHSQLDLPIPRERYVDRHHQHGGRSFYFFDFDDNVMRLPTPIFLFDRHTDKELALSTAEFIAASPHIGKPGPWHSYELRNCETTGSFRRFRDQHEPGAEQPLVEDINAALALPPEEWKGPSWELFFHAVHNQRPLAIITARGHHPTTIARGIARLTQLGQLTARPNYLSLMPVSNREVRTRLGDPERRRPIAELKMDAIIHCVDTAMARFGENPYHRFGMSDDAPENLQLAAEAMRRLKIRYPDNAFFVIDASRSPLAKTEILRGESHGQEVGDIPQLELFSSAGQK